MIKYQQGAILLGFDFENEKPLDSVVVLKGDTNDLNNLFEHPKAVFESKDLEITQRNATIAMRYQGC